MMIRLRFVNKPVLLLLIWVGVLMVLSGCRGAGSNATPQRPSLTPTPRSTHLPSVPTPVPVGAPNNPIRIVFPLLASGRSESAARSAANALETQLTSDTGLSITVEVVANNAEALSALCASTSQNAVATWLSGIPYAAAYVDDCGDAALQVERTEGSESVSGLEVILIGSRAANVASVSALADEVFCRLNYADLNTWLIPSIMLREGGITDGSQFSQVRDYEDIDALIAAVAEGECAGAGMLARDFEERADQADRSATTILATSIDIPFSILIYPLEIPLGQRAALTDAFITIGNGSRGDALLSPLLLHDQIIVAEDTEFARLRSFINQAGLNLTNLGM